VIFCHEKAINKRQKTEQPTGPVVAQNVTIERTISWPMADVNARIAERNIPIVQDMQSYLAKLSQEKQKEIARLLWLSVPAAAAAKGVGLSAKTVSKWYNRLRERSAADREAEREKLEGRMV